MLPYVLIYVAWINAPAIQIEFESLQSCQVAVAAIKEEHKKRSWIGGPIICVKR